MESDIESELSKNDFSKVRELPLDALEDMVQIYEGNLHGYKINLCCYRSSLKAEGLMSDYTLGSYPAACCGLLTTWNLENAAHVVTDSPHTPQLAVE